MEINKLKKKINQTRNEREIDYWVKEYDEAYPNIKVIPISDSFETKNNKKLVIHFKEKYPFYHLILKSTNGKYKKKDVRLKVIKEIIRYLEVIYENGNILIKKENYESISKKEYSTEKNNILKDLKILLYEALLYNKIKENYIKENRPNKKISDSNLKTSFYNIFILDTERWESIIKSLSTDKVIDTKGNWIDLGSNFSKPPTQLSVFLFLMEDNSVINIANQNNGIPEISKYFGISLSSSRYSQVKKGFIDSEGISKHMMHYPIYKKLISYVQL